MSYFTSEWDILKSNSIYIVAMFLSKSQKEHRKKVNTYNICDEMMKLLKSSSARVRNKTAKSLSLLTTL